MVPLAIASPNRSRRCGSAGGRRHLSRRGAVSGGFVLFHDTLCGDDPPYMASLVGGAKKHGEQNFSAGEIKYTMGNG